jgi:membrane protease YdiL (CAAX protease family)
VAGIVAVVAIVATGMHFAFASSRAGEWSFWLLAGGPVIGLSPVALWRAWKRGELEAWLRPRAGDFSLGFVGAGALFAGAYGVSKVVLANGSTRAIWLARLYLQLGDPEVLRAHSVGLFVALVSIAAAEEIVWRGLVASLVADAVPGLSRWAWTVSPLLFAVASAPTMWALAAPTGLNPLLPIAALGAGLVWGGMTQRFGRLVPGIVSHALFDWCIVVMFRLWGESL